MVPEQRGNERFSRFQRINNKHHIYSSGDEANNFHHTEGVHYIIYIIVTNRLATYKELKYDLDLDDVADLYEIAMVNLYNKNVMINDAKNESSAGK